ncbi:hypothetical protein ANCCEY_12704 [Ancylostoma ceylanicum]|uniref:NPHP4 C2-like domain-containing protein n=1 Tax=Ancylostoma ceylanicum TaxID=53326 RepID=A0A0D6LAH7_9BILA|nr:hypothetical protein ANCCEY_12704 [Ancylostoma ceylanicum]
MTSRVNDWYGHFLTRRVVPLRREVPANAVTEGYALVVRKLRLTKLSHNATYHVSCYFFDSKTSQFFGCPYQSAEKEPEHNECNMNDSTASGTLECSLYSHSLIVDAVDYFPDFCIIGNRYEVPGLLPNESGPQLAAPAQMPHVLSSLDELALSFGPHAERIEKLVLDDLNADRLYRENYAPSAKGAPMQVLERRLRIGVHNSFTFLFEPLVVHLSSLDEQLRGSHSLRRKGRPMSRSSSDIRQVVMSKDLVLVASMSEMNSLFVRSRVSLPKMADDDRLVIVFALDYLLGLRSHDKSILYSQSVIICWGAWQPFSNRSQLQMNGRVQASVSLIGGPRPNPEESLCFKNLLHLYRRDDSIFTESAPKITIQFNFVLEDTRSYDSLSRSTIPTPAPRRETIDSEDADKERTSSPKKPELKRDESEATDNEDLLPPIFTKKPTPVTTPKLHQKIDSIIEQESPRQNLPVSYVLPVKEARLLLSDSNSTSNDPNVFKRLNANGEEVVESGSGFMIKFLVDRQRQTENDRDEFITYLCSNSLCVEAWDAESLMLLGASYIPLQSLLRNGKEAVQCTVQCPVVFSALPGMLAEKAGRFLLVGQAARAAQAAQAVLAAQQLLEERSSSSPGLSLDLVGQLDLQVLERSSLTAATTATAASAAASATATATA